MSSELTLYEIYDANINGSNVKAIYLGEIARFKSDQKVIAFRDEKGKIRCHRLRAYFCNNGKLEVKVSLTRKISNLEENFLNKLLTEKGA